MKNTFATFNEYRNEKLITKKQWEKADADQRTEWLEQACEDPDDCTKYADYKYNDLPDWVLSSMYEAITESINEIATVVSKNFGGYDDQEFLAVAWKLPIDELKELITKSADDLKWLRKNSRGVLGAFNRREANKVKTRISLLSQVITHKKEDPNFIPDRYK